MMCVVFGCVEINYCWVMMYVIECVFFGMGVRVWVMCEMWWIVSEARGSVSRRRNVSRINENVWLFVVCVKLMMRYICLYYLILVMIKFVNFVKLRFGNARERWVDFFFVERRRRRRRWWMMMWVMFELRYSLIEDFVFSGFFWNEIIFDFWCDCWFVCLVFFVVSVVWVMISLIYFRIFLECFGVVKRFMKYWYVVEWIYFIFWLMLGVRFILNVCVAI